LLSWNHSHPVLNLKNGSESENGSESGSGSENGSDIFNRSTSLKKFRTSKIIPFLSIK